ncbi:M20 family metallopeptidase [Streptomyces sp. SID8111]|uniref:M20 metallopeptidase family protein n=1 Tax=Streptomyces sp. SID8111 TaxID=2706100 RepID=UPI0019408EC6|nr:M20 family metallopeptidase [Streptomyces sp. SID8111]
MSDASLMQADLTELRRSLHRRPEIGLDLPQTQRAVLAALEGLPLEITLGSSSTSVTAVLRGGRPGPAVLLRGDMDALPVTEATGLEYASEIEGVMHACGHDLHVAMLVGAARLLCARRETLQGDVVFMFQPGEEGYDGARLMIAEGVLEAAGRRVSAAYGLHVSSYRERGVFFSRPGPLMSGSHELRVVVEGAGGHGSLPHLSRDPVNAAAEMVTALQSMVTRRFDIFDPVVLSVGVFRAGTKINIVPDEAGFEATLRSFSPAAGALLRAETRRVCEGIAAAHGLTAVVRFTDGFPVTVNDRHHHDVAGAVVSQTLGADRFRLMDHPVAASEDFSFVLNEVPGCYVHLGARVDTGSDAPAAPNHSAHAVFDDGVLSDGALVLAELALRALRNEAAVRSGPPAHAPGGPPCRLPAARCAGGCGVVGCEVVLLRSAR